METPVGASRTCLLIISVLHITKRIAKRKDKPGAFLQVQVRQVVGARQAARTTTQQTSKTKKLRVQPKEIPGVLILTAYRDIAATEPLLPALHTPRQLVAHKMGNGVSTLMAPQAGAALTQTINVLCTMKPTARHKDKPGALPRAAQAAGVPAAVRTAARPPQI